jgi:hypothetical protein
MAIGLGPGKGKKKNDQPKSKIGGGIGKTTVAPGYKMTLVRKQGEPATKTKTIAGSPVGTKVTTPVGVYAPMPVAPAKKVAAAPKKKTAVGKAIKKVARDIDYAVSTTAYSLKPSVQKRGTFKGGGGGSKRGTKTCAAYR